MRPIRTGAAVVALLLAVPAAAAAQTALTAPTASCPAFTPPGGVSSSGGVLSTSLTMQPGTYAIGDSTWTTNVYNQQFTAPVLRMNPGDSLRIAVSNQMVANAFQPDSNLAWTNQHYHGMVVTPKPDSGDNVVPFQLWKGQTNVNRFFVPPYQSQGFMWYHPHPHGSTAVQVGGGLAGALLIGDLLSAFPQYRGATERVMMVKQNVNGNQTNINGNPCTFLPLQPFERQLWRIGNMTAATWLNLKLRGVGGGRLSFTVLAWDGNPLASPTPADSLFVPPGGRVEVIVTAPMGGGSWEFFSDSLVDGFSPTAPSNPDSVTWQAPFSLGWVFAPAVPTERAAPPRLAAHVPDPVLLDSIRRIREDTTVNRFVLHYGLDAQGNLVLNDSSYDPSRLDTAVPSGQTQEWTLINDTWFLHTFHIHQTDFLVTEINGVPQADSVFLDNVHLGVHRRADGTWVGDTVVIRWRFHPIAQGPFVYHCHNLFHEDDGMMANVCVYDPATGESTCDQWFGENAGHRGHAAHPRPAAPAPSAAARDRERRRR